MKSNYPDSLTIQQYLEGSLNPEVMHQLEKQALDDPFLWEALEGYSAYKDPSADLSMLQRQLHERIVHLQENKKVFDLTWQRLSIATAAAVLFILSGILFWMNGHKAAPQNSSEKQVEVSLIDPDSLSSVIQGTEGMIIASESDLPGVLYDESAFPRPEDGWSSYISYLKRQAAQFKGEDIPAGNVILSVEVNGEGKLSNIKVLKGLSDACDKEAVRLVREGPQWTGLPDGTTGMSRVEVKFGS